MKDNNAQKFNFINDDDEKNFEWHKKDNKTNVNEKQIELELKKLRKRKKTREEEDKIKEMERKKQMQIKEAVEYEHWVAQEDSFQLEQAKNRCKIRLNQNRAKPIDYILFFVHPEECGDVEAVMADVVQLIDSLEKGDLLDLKSDILFFKKFETDKKSIWESLYNIVEFKLVDANMDPKIVSSVHKIFDGKNASQLKMLREQILKKLSVKSVSLDQEYWECVLREMDHYSEKLKISEIFRGRNKFLAKSKQKQEITKEVKKTILKKKYPYRPEYEPEYTLIDPNINYQTLNEFVSTVNLQREYVIHGDRKEKRDLQAITDYYLKEEKELAQLPPPPPSEIEEIEVDDEFNQPCEDNQTTFRVASNYLLKKPQFFNKIHTGYEWNKYNQTHYDTENPPPKIVRGYRFNIYYPELIDKKTVPTYKVYACKDSSFSIIKFVAGPPYEDIAFKIVNDEWNYQDRRRFRCRYEDNVFQLWFKFKIDRYKR